MRNVWTPTAVLLCFALVELVHYFLFIRLLLGIGQLWANITYWLWIVTCLYYMIGFAVASFCSPGYVERNWMESESFMSTELNTNGEQPFCKRCRMPRPLRSHHCKECKRCVVMMDHHCCFLGNCIGIRNFRPFFIFLCSYPVHALLGIASVFIVINRYGAGVFQVIVIGLSLVYFVIAGVFVGVQLVPQVGMLVRNATSIEDKEKTRVKYLYERMNVKLVDEFGTGSILANMREKLGQNMILWLLPVPDCTVRYRFKRNPEFVPRYHIIRNGCSTSTMVIP